MRRLVDFAEIHAKGQAWQANIHAEEHAEEHRVPNITYAMWDVVKEAQGTELSRTFAVALAEIVSEFHSPTVIGLLRDTPLDSILMELENCLANTILHNVFGIWLNNAGYNFQQGTSTNVLLTW